MSMSLEQWAKNGWLRPHKSSKQEIADLLAIVDRDLKDAEGDISTDWKFGIAYNAALKLCTILLHAFGLSARKESRALSHARSAAAHSGREAEGRRQLPRYLSYQAQHS